MILELEAFATVDKRPEPHKHVIVQGGLAVFDGHQWLSAVHDGCRYMRPIEWPVLWWMECPTVDTLEELQPYLGEHGTL